MAAHDFGYDDLEKIAKKRPCGHPWAALVAFDLFFCAASLGYDVAMAGNERRGTVWSLGARRG